MTPSYLIDLQTPIIVGGRYALFREFASGGMASVHFGRLLGPVGFSRPVAIKRLHPQLIRDKSACNMFVDEARLAARIQHPNVVQTLDVVREGNELLLVLEYIHGEALGKLARASRARGEPIPWPMTLAIMSNVLHGLHAAHEAKTEEGTPLNIVHRDVSPQNVLVGIDGIARVLDFGVARADVRRENTGAGIVKGKIAYMAPEQLNGRVVTRAADIFAAGVVMWELLAGRRFLQRDGEDEGMFIETLLKGDYPLPSEFAPHMPKELDAVVERALQRAPADRFATAREMAFALENTERPASPARIGAWVEALAAETLEGRSMQLSEFERSSARIQSVPPLHQRSTKAPSSGTISVAVPVPVRAGPSLPTARLGPAAEPERRLPPILVRAAVAGAVIAAVVGSAALRGRFASRREPTPPSSAPAAAPVSPLVAPEAPPCPQGMQPIPGGQFFMGSDDGMDVEKPAHSVSLLPYCMDKFEVTTGDYVACSDRGACKRASNVNSWSGMVDREHKIYDGLCNARDALDRMTHPINCVDWEMASIFCKANGKRLPSEAEWEFAARGPDGRRYPWGDDAPGPDRLNACGAECVAWGKENHVEEHGMYVGDDGFPSTAPVGTFPKGASPFGVEDVVGNVWEWVADYYAPYPSTGQVQPTGPDNGDHRVIRGGAWNGGYAAWVRPTFRYKAPPENRSYGIGFRCAKSQ